MEQSDHDRTRLCSEEEEKKKRIEELTKYLETEHFVVFERTVASRIPEYPELARNILVRTAITLEESGTPAKTEMEANQRATLIMLTAEKHCGDEDKDGWTKTAMWERARNGDPFAKNGLCLQYAEVVRNTLRGMRLRPEDLDDRIQSTWESALRNIRKANGPQLRRFESWLVTIARNEGYDCFRRQKGKPEKPVSQMTFDTEAIESATEMLDMLDSKESIARSIRLQHEMHFRLDLSKGRAQLSPVNRQILDLYLQGDSENEIAGKVNRAQSTISENLHKIFGKLNQFFKITKGERK